jgi:hypothetical protein
MMTLELAELATLSSLLYQTIAHLKNRCDEAVSMTECVLHAKRNLWRLISHDREANSRNFNEKYHFDTIKPAVRALNNRIKKGVAPEPDSPGS